MRGVQGSSKVLVISHSVSWVTAKQAFIVLLFFFKTYTHICVLVYMMNFTVFKNSKIRNYEHLYYGLNQFCYCDICIPKKHHTVKLCNKNKRLMEKMGFRSTTLKNVTSDIKKKGI